jgi:ubiquinone/menaquinone biosynthesis C-methylase UbiE
MNKTKKNEYPNTYFVQDRSGEEELSRLQLQDGMLTRSMGGALPEQIDPTLFRHVLDVGCGTGGWLIEVARAYPTIQRLVGIDVSQKMISYALAQAHKQGFGNRIEFYVMDALRLLDFPASSFDLINQRLGASYLRTWEWSQLLSEYQRLGRHEAVLRITESANFQTSSPAFAQLYQLLMNALAQAGHITCPAADAIQNMIPDLFHRHGIQHIHTRTHKLIYVAGTDEGEQLLKDSRDLIHNTLPFLRKWIHIPANYEELYQQMLLELQQPDFEEYWSVQTVWGVNSKQSLIK